MKLCTTVIAILLSLLTSAQNIKIKKQDVFINDSPYCKIIGKTGISAAISNEQDFTIASLTGEELIYVKKAGNNFITVTFLSDGRRMKMKKSPTALTGQKDFIKKMYDANLLEDGMINNYNREFFLEKTEDPEQNGDVVVTSANGKYNVVERNLNEAVSVYEDNIEQDGQVIGTYIIADEATNDGIAKSVVSFYLMNGTKAAKLDVESANTRNNTLLTLKNNNLVTLQELSGSINDKGYENIKATALWLIKRGYL